jgi:hypothetical protein
MIFIAVYFLESLDVPDDVLQKLCLPVNGNADGFVYRRSRHLHFVHFPCILPILYLLHFLFHFHVHSILFNPLTHITFFTSSISHFPTSKNKSLKPNALFLIVII